MSGPGRFGGGPRALRRLVNRIPQEVERQHVGRSWQAPAPRRNWAVDFDEPFNARAAIYGALALLLFLLFLAVELYA